MKIKSNLTLATLAGYLQHYYKDKSSTDFGAQLTSITQMPNELPEVDWTKGEINSDV